MSHDLRQQFIGCADLQLVLDRILQTSLRVAGTTLGNVQLMDWTTGDLTIAAQQGFSPYFLDFFRIVSAHDRSACGRAIRNRDQVVIEDVQFDAEYGPLRSIADEAGFRGVVSIPLISAGNAFVGVFSVHFARPNRPTHREMALLQTVSRLGANAIIEQRSHASLLEAVSDAEAHERRMHTSMAAIDRSHDLLDRITRKVPR